MRALNNRYVSWAVGFVLFMLGGGFQILAQSSVETLTLEQAVSMALEQNRSLKMERLGIREMREQRAAAQTQRLPALSIESNSFVPLNRGFIPPPFGPTTFPIQAGAVFSFRAEQPVTEFYRAGLRNAQARLSEQMAEARWRAQAQRITAQVKQTYHALALTDSSLRKLEADLRLYREIERVTGEYVATQVALKVEGLEARSRIAQAEYEALSLENARAAQAEQLNLLLGRNPQTAFSLSYELPASLPAMDLSSATTLALQQRPELEEARLRVKQSEYETRLKRSQYLPEVSAYIQFQGVRGLNLQFAPSNYAIAGVRVSWEPFDWGRRKREVAAAKLAQERNQLALVETEQQIHAEVSARFRRLREARELVRVRQLMQEAADESLRIATLRVSERVATAREALQAQATHATAVTQYQEALRQYWNAIAEFENAIGGRV